MTDSSCFLKLEIMYEEGAEGNGRARREVLLADVDRRALGILVDIMYGRNGTETAIHQYSRPPAELSSLITN